MCSSAETRNRNNNVDYSFVRELFIWINHALNQLSRITYVLKKTCLFFFLGVLNLPIYAKSLNESTANAESQFSSSVRCDYRVVSMNMQGNIPRSG